LYEEFFPLTDIETQLPPVFDRFYSDAAKRTCGRCHAVMQPPVRNGAAGAGG
jgi:3-hydroxyanthranilate 3,4-dioxygenase